MTRCAACGFLLPLPRPPSDPQAHPKLDAAIQLGLGTLLRERYRLIELIGQGAHGLTFLAHHEFLDHPCVVKVLPHRIESPSDGAVRRLRNEASAGFRVNHANVVRVLDGDAVQGIWYFVMEYVDGVDLAATTGSGVLLDWRQALDVAIDAAQGLEAIHRAGLVHHDIKPGNLILGTDRRVRLADLGVARLISSQAGLDGSAQSPRDGTLAYAAPELLAGDQQVGPQADLYSLGATLYELVTGSLPRGESVYRTLLDPDRGSISWPADAPADIPSWFVDAILKLLDPVPQNRFRSPAALVACLERPDGRPAQARTVPQPDYPEPRGLVVLPFENGSAVEDDDWLGHALANHLARSLAQLDGAYVADLDQFLQTLERVMQRTPHERGKQLREAGRLSGAATVIEGTFRRAGELIELSARVHQSTGQAPVCIEPVAGALSTLADLETALLGKLNGALGLSSASANPSIRAPGGSILAAEERFFTAKRAFLRGDYETAARLGKEALELDASFGDAFGLVAACCARIGRYDDAAMYNRRQELLADQEHDEQLKAQAKANTGSMCYFRGDYEAARNHLESAATLAERLGLTVDLAQIRNNLGFVLVQLGRPAEAGETFLRAIETLKRYSALVALVGPYNGMGHVLREQKHYAEARDYFRRALTLAQESDDYVNMGIAYMNLGHCAVLQGRLADAKHELAVALNILEQTSFWNGLARVYEHMADLNLRLSNCAEATRCAEQRIGLARRHANLRMESAAWRQKALALKLAGQPAEAQRCLTRVVDDKGDRYADANPGHVSDDG